MFCELWQCSLTCCCHCSSCCCCLPRQVVAIPMLRPPLCLRPVPRGGGGGWPRFCLGLPYGVWLLQQGAGGGCRLRPLRQEAGELCIQPCWAQHAVLGGWAGEGDVCWGSGLRWEAVVCKGGGGGQLWLRQRWLVRWAGGGACSSRSSQGDCGWLRTEEGAWPPRVVRAVGGFAGQGTRDSRHTRCICAA
jgi:hypothetical protein